MKYAGFREGNKSNMFAAAVHLKTTHNINFRKTLNEKYIYMFI